MHQTKYKPKSNVTASKQMEQQQVYFRLRRPNHLQTPEQQLIINRNPRKRTYKSSEQMSKQMQLTKQQQQKQTNNIVSLFSQMGLKNSVQYFLRRVEDLNIKYNTQSEQILNNKVLQKSNQLSQQTRKLNRQRLFDKNRGIDEWRPIKIVDLDDDQYVQFNNKKIKVQNMDSNGMNQYYYVLHKRNKIKQGPTVSIPQDATHLLDRIQFQQQMSEQQNKQQEDDQDSNRQSNPDYDYPEEKFSEDSGDEGVINKDYYYIGSEEEYDKDSEDEEIDAEEHYRRYLQRCRKNRNKQQYSDDD